MARTIRWLLYAGIAVLYVASVPWYRTAGAEPALIFGFPDWVAVAVGCYAGVAVLNACAWMLTDIRDEEAE